MQHFAIGWEGNFQAATSLIERLFDNDSEVQQIAVNALCNLRNDKIFDLLLDRLNHGPVEQKEIQVLLDDPDMKVKRAAVNIRRKNRD